MFSNPIKNSEETQGRKISKGNYFGFSYIQQKRINEDLL